MVWERDSRGVLRGSQLERRTLNLRAGPARGGEIESDRTGTHRTCAGVCRNAIPYAPDCRGRKCPYSIWHTRVIPPPPRYPWDGRGDGCPIYLGRAPLVPEELGMLVPLPPGVSRPLRRLASVPGSVLGASPCCLNSRSRLVSGVVNVPGGSLPRMDGLVVSGTPEGLPGTPERPRVSPGLD
jgi:hypothetical protein